LSLKFPPYVKHKFLYTSQKTFSIESLELSAKTFALGPFWSFSAKSSKISHMPNTNSFALNRKLLVLKVCDQMNFFLHLALLELPSLILGNSIGGQGQ
jgi:hypothetical protein